MRGRDRLFYTEEGSLYKATHKRSNWVLVISKQDKSKIDFASLTRQHKGLDKQLGLEKRWYPYFYGKDGKAVYVHRAIVGIEGKGFKDIHVHHSDGNTFNNSRENLFILTREQHKRIHQFSKSSWNYWLEAELMDKKTRLELGLLSREEYLKGTGKMTVEDRFKEEMQESQVEVWNKAMNMDKEVKKINEDLSKGIGDLEGLMDLKMLEDMRDVLVRVYKEAFKKGLMIVQKEKEIVLKGMEGVVRKERLYF